MHAACLVNLDYNVVSSPQTEPSPNIASGARTECGAESGLCERVQHVVKVRYAISLLRLQSAYALLSPCTLELCQTQLPLVDRKQGEIATYISSDEGVRQGCVLGLLVFAVATLGCCGQ
jgi:hypothetical protein